MHPTTIVLRKSQSSQAALVPKEHKMFMEEAYNAGDHQPWDAGGPGYGVVRLQGIPPCPSARRSPGDESRGESGTSEMSRGEDTVKLPPETCTPSAAPSHLPEAPSKAQKMPSLTPHLPLSSHTLSHLIPSAQAWPSH